MASARLDEEMLLDLLNTTPVVDGVPQDRLDDPEWARSWSREHGGAGSAAESRVTRQVRDALQAVVRGERAPGALATYLEGVSYVPSLSDEGLDWTLDVPPAHEVAARAVLAWSGLEKTGPGRLRPCANTECRLFLIDRSKVGNARWCSMAVCGNRMKARRHYQRAREV
ncbi:CGNR zinc finger domain-containing protein [Actinoallomurus bryophytorum]|uniref:Putative RNA-binding Zn ribbon-like protein n=1 Tax=Actinoallomurus bryophytorum TaxID=1490222 RepID=A0A543BSV6_9ACTN|nr:CGNR zinc finger domain-containing protein [Actinoallomurus bryophytorum]TQL87816.1 putative RNA-binding Zn ribbon-like protein [Actinoallomurus bryophytorum]